MNRTIAYCAADTLRKLGYEWDGEAWVTTEPQAEPHYTITWDAQGRRLVNGALAPEHRTAKPAQQPQGEPINGRECCNRKAQAGEVEVRGIFAPPALHAKIKAAAARVRRKETA